MDIVDKNTIKTRIIRLLEDADKLGKFTRDMKKPEFIAKQQAKYDVIFDISATPNKNPVSRTTKGQLISKCPYEKSVSSKIPTKIFLGFLPWKFTTSRLVQNRVYLLANRT